MNATKTTNVYNAENHNLYFIPNALGDYKFDVDWSSSNPSLKVTFPTAYAVTFGKGTGGSSVTAKYNSTSFNSGTKVQQGKTVTFTQSASTGYTFKEWNTKADGTGTKLSAEATYTHTVTTSNNVYAVYTQNPDRTIYLEPTGFWNSNNPQYVAHVWGSGDEDITMTGVGEAPYKYYTCDVPAKYTNIVFYRKSTDGSTIWNQTADLTLPNKSTALYTIKSTATPSEGEWKDAYAKFLKELSNENHCNQFGGKPQFELAYINDDNIPELVITYGGSHLDEAYLYTFLNDEVKPIKSSNSDSNGYGVYGTFIYKERDSLIYIGGYSSNSIWHVDENMIATQKYLLSMDESNVFSTGKVSYFDNGVEITEAQYNAKYKEYGFNLIRNKYKRIEYGKSHDVTDDNIKTVLKINK